MSFTFMERYRVVCDDCGETFMEWQGAKLRVTRASGKVTSALLCDLCIARIVEELEYPARKVKPRR